MTPLNWIKNRSRHSPLVISQIIGLTAVLLSGIAVYFVSTAIYLHNPQRWTVPYVDRRGEPVIVELAGDTKQRGIYYLKGNPSVSSFLKTVGVTNIEYLPEGMLKKNLISGMVVILERDLYVSIGDMCGAKRLALDLPIDVNRATFDDLILIPGIKEATAQKILEFRRAAGGRIGRMEDLMGIPGIKEKRMEHLRHYLYVASNLRGDS
ncbi:MAG: helix-hairpin-helix domain-containing protein [Syntrophales bacterium]|nr:helix-hairpin-helix domain-containing protein [Syntrophales bacterium]